ncbi:uncharacterized protein LOC123534235 [Mercenaria mercenaria]|uniref:uncharacterized protein LOC123534235 n=1 Tax=Mercenaria mercenaria TaxID=6596 RepID=UPI00234E5FFD|nr:uncharacterized protein LOC123534235 [Mercenaria mercenaria]
MEKDNTEQALINLESSLKKFHENASEDSTAESKGSESGENKEMTEKCADQKNDKGYVSDFFEDRNPDVKTASGSSAKESSDLEKNPKQAFDQFKVKPAVTPEIEQIASSSSKPRRPSAEEIAKNWQDLGVQRCPNCKFTTDNMELFKNHCTTCVCPSDRSTGRITITYKDGEFKCIQCEDVWTIKAEFEEHIVCHLQESPYVCLTCQNKKFPSRQQIEIHTKNEHPSGDARCGLKGMKTGRKYTEELMRQGTITIQGKLSIPKTPRNHVSRIIPKETVTSQTQLYGSKIVDVNSSATSGEVVSKPIGQLNPATPSVVTALQPKVIPVNSASISQVKGSTIHHRPIVLNMINSRQVTSGASNMIASAANTTPMVTPPTTVVTSSVDLQLSSASQAVITSQSIFSTVLDSDTESISSRPMPPARTSLNLIPNVSPSHLYTSKSGTLVRVSPGEVAKSKHLDTLFGELNRTTNVMQPTVVSQKIKDIANPSAADPKEVLSKPIQYHLKTITEYTCTQPTKTVSSAVSSMPLLLVPVGQPIVHPQGQIISSTGILYQSPSNAGVFVPIQPKSGNSILTGSNIRVQQAPVVTSIPQNLHVVNHVPQNTVVLTPGAAQSVRSQNNNSGASNIQYITQADIGSIKSVASTSRVMPPLQPAPGAQMNPPPSYREAIEEKHVTDRSKIPPPLTIPAAASEDHKIPKKFLFKIKPGQGFVCEACKKFTRDEFVFRRHVWDHFHGDPLACKTCSPDFIARKIILECKLVNNIVCNLIKRSTQEVQEIAAKPLKVLKVGENEIIDITDDEEDKNESKQHRGQDHVTEVIVVDDEDENGDGQGLQIRISNTFSLSSMQNLEQMPKKDTQQNDEVKTPGVQRENDKQDIQNKLPQSSLNLPLVVSGEQKGFTSSPSVGESQHTASETSSSHPLSGQIHLKKHFGLTEIESSGNKSVVEKQSSAESAQNGSKAQLDTRGEQKGLSSSSSVQNSEHTASETTSTHQLSGQIHLKKHFGLNENESVGVKQSSTGGEGEDDEDGKIKGTDLLDKSLSEPGNDSEEVVSQVLETNLKDYDPTKNTPEEDLDEEPNFEGEKGQPNPLELNGLAKTTKSHENDGPSNTTDSNIDHVNVRGKTAFESEILSKQSNNAFYVCGYENCLFTGMTSTKYREHIQSKQHANEYNYVCGHCGQKDYTEDTHVRHIFSHANSKTFLLYKCPIRLCKYKTNLLHMYADHLRAHPNEELTVKCTYCHKTFPTVDSLEQHLKQNLLKFIICPYCTFKFVNKYVVTTHIRLFHPDKLRMVSVTSQVVCNEREINFYVAPKSKALPHSDLSEKDIQDTDNIDIPALLDDFQKESAAKDKPVQEQTVVGKGSENGDTDDVLSLPEEDQGDFKERKNLLKEQKDNQKENSSRKPVKAKGKSDTNTKGGPKSLECPQCSYLSYNQSLYAKHLSLHDTEPEREKRFVCNLCPKGAESLPHFKTHVRNHVGKHTIKVYCCTTCAYCSNQKCHIMDHVQDAHAEETMYTLKEELVESNHSECSYCAFKARTSEQVSAHETIVHRVDPAVKSNNDSDNMAEEKGDGKTENVKSLKSAFSENESGTVSGESETVTRKKKYKYHCEYCSEFFKHKSNLKEHMINEHRDIDNKQFIFFKCKYCIYTSTMKDMIIGHLEKDHSGLDLRILRKIEVVENDHPERNKKMAGSEVKSSVENQDDDESNDKKESSDTDKIEIVIPDGNIFKQVFTCPSCSFSTNMRIKAMKHLKEHPELKPIRPDQKKTPSKPTARKSSGSLFPKVDLSKKKSSLIQQLPESATPLQNPFTAVKESMFTKDSTSTDKMLNSPSKDPYILGEQKLHAALSACFIPFEKDMKFQCRICKQKIFKKFVLHRHILDHLKIVFFKCKYCDEGSIERTLMVGHIQKEHASKTVQYDFVEKSVLEQQFKERIFSQNFNDTLDISTTSGNQGDTADEVKNIGIVKKAVHEYQTIDDDSSEENDGLEEPVKESEEADKSNSLKCPKCRYVARFKHYLNLHMESHNDPMKVFTCSVCDYRGDKFSVIKHVYSVFHLTQAKVLENGKPLYENLNSQKDKETVKSDKSKNESKTVVAEDSKQGEDSKTCIDSKYVTNSQGKQIKVDSITVSQSGVFEMKTLYKCKECGHKRESKSAMYLHFKTSKCNKPVVKCSLCSFQNTVKAAIHRHAEKRHPGKKISILDLPLSAKMKIVKFPVRQDKSIIKDLKRRDTEDADSFDSSLPESPADVVSNISEGESPEEGQIRCQLCTNYLCESTMKLQFHVNTAHQGATLYCKECSYKSPLVKHMINHCKNLHYQKVALYGDQPRSVKKTETKMNVKQEKVLKTTSSAEEKIVFKCPKCDLELSTLKVVQMHLYVHFNYKPYCCRYCGKCSGRLDHIKKHIESQHEGKAIKYDTKIDEAIESKVRKIHDSVKRNVARQRIMLGKSRPSKLDKMELVEEGIRKKEKVFYCDFCHYHSDRKATVRNHVSNVHSGISKKRPLEVDSDTDSPVRKAFKKQDDNSEIASSTSSVIDEDEGETEQNGDESPPLKYKVVKTPNGTKQFGCTGCHYMNEKIKNLKLHVSRHHGTLLGKKEYAFKCYFCSYSTAHGSSDIFKHFKTHHSSMKTVKYINKYGKVLTRDVSDNKSDSSSPGKSSALSSPARSGTESVQNDYSPIKPVQQKRTGTTNYNCKYCSYSGTGFFNFRLHLIAHEEFTQLTTELDDESKMSCGFCSYLGKNTFELSVHIASHMGDMRYKCAYCDYTQFTSFKVSQHMRYCHADRNEIVVDRELRKATSGMIKLVNFNPTVNVKKMKRWSKKRKFKRIMIETDESSNNTSSENEDGKLSDVETSTKATNSSEESMNKSENISAKQFDRTDGSLNEDKEENTHKKESEKDECPLTVTALTKPQTIPEEQPVVACRLANSEYEENSEITVNNSVSEDAGSNETQIFRIETQPFSPSDVKFAECDDLNDDECDDFQIDEKEQEVSIKVSSGVEFSLGTSGNIEVKCSETEKSAEQPYMMNCQKDKQNDEIDEHNKTNMEESADTESEENLKGSVDTESKETSKGSENTESEENSDGSENTESKENLNGSENTESKETSKGSENTESKKNLKGRENTESKGTLKEREDTESDENLKGSEIIESKENFKVEENTESKENFKGNESTESKENLKEIESIKSKENVNESKNAESKGSKNTESKGNLKGIGNIEPKEKLKGSENTETYSETTEKESETESKFDTEMEVENDCLSITEDNATVELGSTNGAKSKSEQNEKESPNVKDIDSIIDNKESDKDCSSRNIDIIICANEDMHNLQRSELKDDADNACTSTNTNVIANDGFKETQNEGILSPRNLFQSISDPKNAVCEKSEPENCDVTKEPILAESKREELESTCNELANENVFEKFSSEIQLGESSYMCKKGELDNSSVEERRDNIFEKFTNDCVTNSGDHGAETGSDVSPVENSEKNIFDTFGNINYEKSERSSAQECGNLNADKNDLTDVDNQSSQNSDEKHELAKESNSCEEMDTDIDSNIFSKLSEQLEVAGPKFTDQTDNQNVTDINDSNIFTKFSTTKNGKEENINEYDDDLSDKDNDKNLFEKFDSENLRSVPSECDDKQLITPQTDLNDRKHPDKKTLECSNVETEKCVDDMEIDELINSIEQTVNERMTEESDRQNDQCEMETD